LNFSKKSFKFIQVTKLDNREHIWIDQQPGKSQAHPLQLNLRSKTASEKSLTRKKFKDGRIKIFQVFHRDRLI
jgi:hypothetical protein